MHVFQFGVFFFLISTVAAKTSSEDWLLASNAFDLNSPNVDFTLADPDYSDIFSSHDSINSDDGDGLFTNDAQAKILADGADTGDECSLPHSAGKRHLGRRQSECGTSGIVTSSPSMIGTPSSFDQLYCPTEAIFLYLFFVCSSPNFLETLPGPLFYTLLRSKPSKYINRHFLLPPSSRMERRKL